MDIERKRITKIECLGNFEDEYVYDLSIDGEKSVFFANDILVKNTDSIFFTLPTENILGIDPKTIDKDTFIELSNTMANSVNASFPIFYSNTFNAPLERCKVIKCGREICATNTLLIKKKRYASLYYIDDKNIRHDKNGKNGKLKIMGLDTKRSDCPKWIQDKLVETLENLLDKDMSLEELTEYIRTWRGEFRDSEPWKMGTPKKVNKLTFYRKVYDSRQKGATIPGHVKAAIEWNNLMQINGDMNSTPIQDGQKVIVCKMKTNHLGIKAVAYPIDQTYLPKWFKELPFDTDHMTELNVDQRVKNIFGVLDLDLAATKQTDDFSKMFTFV